MTTILRIDSSSRPAGSTTEGSSFTRAITDHLVGRLIAADPSAEMVSRDLSAQPIPHIAPETITGYYTDPAQMTLELMEATAMSDTLIEELSSADIIVLSAPIYNFSVPSALKAWIDQIVRRGRTFAYEDGQFRGLLKDRPVYLVLGYGAAGYGDDGPLAAFDYLRPYLSHVLSFIGLRSQQVFTIESTTGPDAPERLAIVKAQIDGRVTP